MDFDGMKLLAQALLKHEMRDAANQRTKAEQRIDRITDYVDSKAARIIELATGLTLDMQVTGLLCLVSGLPAGKLGIYEEGLDGMV